ncbi:MAG TPA: pyridoxamine 5'-phosphate oxidase family protein [Bryobacteraceae bacterium]|nr:pyridoxamine 5'-phosphate oxidase family protein [Bryobacteraceae bacterium]
MDIDPAFLIHDESTLSELYGPALERSVRKQTDHLDDLCRAFIAASPLIVIGTQNGSLADTSPRGDAPGFVRVADDHTLIIPDRRGNNRLDTLRNIVHNPSVGIIFFVPGRNETFRVNGEAVVSRDPALLAQFAVQDKLPRTVLIVKVREAYIHCSRALVRADLWNPAKYAAPGTVPTFGAMLEAHTCGMVKADAVDAEAVTRVPATLY